MPGPSYINYSAMGSRQSSPDFDTIVGAMGGSQGGVAGPTLGALSLTGSLTQGVAASSVSITGATANSTITLNISGLTVNGTGTSRTVTGTPAASGALNATETLVGASNTPRVSNGIATVAVADTPITNWIREGDSRTQGGVTPDSSSSTQPGDTSGSVAYLWRATHPELTIRITAMPGRVVGSNANFNDGGNSLHGQASADLEFNPQAMTADFGANDMQIGTWATMKANLINVRTKYPAAPGFYFIWNLPVPYRSTSPDPNYSNFTTQRGLALADARNPAQWTQWADVYNPSGEASAFKAADNSALFNDTIHLSAMGYAAQSLSDKACLDTFLDRTRVNSTTMYDAAWPGGETGLTPGATITRRFYIKGIAHQGLSSGMSVSGGGSPTLSLFGSAPGTTFGTNSSNGYRSYNGDEVDLTITLPNTNSTDTVVSLQVGSETRPLTYRTAAVAPQVTATDMGITSVNNTNTATHVHSITVPADGLLVMAVNVAEATGSTLGLYAPGTSTPALATATKRTQVGPYAHLEIWTVPTTAGTYDIRLGLSGSTLCSAIHSILSPNGDYLSAASTQPGTANGPYSPDPFTIPANGLGLVWCAFDGNGSSVPYDMVAATGSTELSKGYSSRPGERFGLTGAKRTTAGTGQNIAFGNSGQFANPPRGSLVLKPAGT